MDRDYLKSIELTATKEQQEYHQTFLRWVYSV